MAGRPKKKSIIKDIDEIKEEVKIEPVNTPENIEEAKEEPEIIEKVEPSGDIRTVKANPWLNVRNKPSFDGMIIGKLDDGDKVTIYEIRNSFGKISDSEEKWVSLDFVV